MCTRCLGGGNVPTVPMPPFPVSESQGLPVTVTLALGVSTATLLAEAARSAGCSPERLAEQALKGWLAGQQPPALTPARASVPALCPSPAAARSRLPEKRRRVSTRPASGTILPRCNRLPSSYWADLPAGVASLVFNWLDPASAAAARRSCSSWAEQLFASRRELQLELPVSAMRFASLAKLPALRSVKLAVRSDWVAPQVRPVATLLRGSSPAAWTSLDLGNTGWQLDGPALAPLVGLTSIRKLSLRNSRADAPALASLSSLTSVTQLDIHGCAVGLGGLDALAGMSALTSLDWSSNSTPPSALAGDAGASVIGPAVFDSLTSLNLANTGLGDRSLGFLARMPALRELDLSITPDCPSVTKHSAWLGNQALAVVSRLSALRSLRVRNQFGLTSEGLATLAALPALTELDLTGCLSAMEDNDLRWATGLTSLRSLSLQAVNSCSGPSPAELLQPLAELTGLTWLDLSQNWSRVSLDALTPLAGLSNLAAVDLTPGRGQWGWLQSGDGGLYELGTLVALLARSLPLMKSIVAAERAREHALGLARPVAWPC